MGVPEASVNELGSWLLIGMPLYVCMCDSELCTELLSQVALTPLFKHWELDDIERAMRVDVQQLNQSPPGSEFICGVM